MQGVHITDIEAAINFWRAKTQGQEHSLALAAPVRVLAELYGQMIFHRQSEADFTCFPPEAQQAWLDWFATLPQTPCVGICSTVQGDNTCKGCGLRFEEVRDWTSLTPVQKRQIWRRLQSEAAQHFDSALPAESSFAALQLPGQSLTA